MIENDKKHPFSHLSSEQIEELYSHYMNGALVTNLLHDFNLVISPSQLYKCFPLIEHTGCYCNSCKDVTLLSNRPSKSNYCSWINLEMFCSSCGTCLTVGDHLKQIEFRDYLLQKEITPVSIKNLSFKDKLYLLTILKGQSSASLSKVLPFSSHYINDDLPLFPSEAMKGSVTKYLFDENYLIIDSNTDCFQQIDFIEDIYDDFYISDRSFLPNIVIDGEKVASIKDLIETLIYELVEKQSEKDIQDIYNLWLDIGVQEVLFMMRNYISNEYYGLPFKCIDMTEIVVRDLLVENRSVSDVFYFSYMAIKNAAEFLSKKICSNPFQAGNSIPGRIKRFSDSYNASNRKTIEFERKSYNPRSAISYLLFDSVLKLNDRVAFYQNPRIYCLENLEPDLYLKSQDKSSGLNFGSTKTNHNMTCLVCNSPDINIRWDYEKSKKNIMLGCPDCGFKGHIPVPVDITKTNCNTRRDVI